jgi:hypothetical protein
MEGEETALQDTTLNYSYLLLSCALEMKVCITTHFCLIYTELLFISFKTTQWHKKMLY